MQTETFVGTPHSRVDGHAKVTGSATYSAEFGTINLLHGAVVSSGIAKGRIKRLDTGAALKVPGVVQVFTHENRPRTAWLSSRYQDQVGPPGSPFRPLYSDKVVYSGQPIALVVADDFGVARYAATLIEVEYEVEAHETDLSTQRKAAYVPPKKRSGISPPPKPRGNVTKGLKSSDVRIAQEYSIASEFHNPLEPHATTVVWDGGGRITVHDKIQGVVNSQAYVSSVFGIAKDDLRVVTPFVGGGFGSGLRPQYQLFLAVMAALELERSVRVVLTRDQMFTHVFRPETINTVELGASRDGTLQAIRHEAVACTSRFEDHQEVVVSWSGLLYHCDNVDLTYKLAQLDTYSPGDMRAPGAPLGVFALESAMDELAYATGVDPVALRLKNYGETDENEDKPYTSKALREAFRLGGEQFGWAKRNPAPRSMREGRELIGWGMATGVWEASMQKTSASATMSAEGKLVIANMTADLGTGTYTILTQIAADALGLPMASVTTKLGDTDFPEAPLAGGSWTAASSGAAVADACEKLRHSLLRYARAIDDSPLANADESHVSFERGRIVMNADPSRFVTLQDAVRASGGDEVSQTGQAAPDSATMKTYSSYTHSAVFVEVRIDEELGVVRVTRVVDAICAGKILNPKTARSQIIGGVVFGIGMALHEESMTDHVLGRVMNHNLAEYHVPANADIQGIEVIFVDEPDAKTSPLGVKGLGEIGIIGTAAAIANAVFHATGKRIRDLPITIDKLLSATSEV